MSSPALAVSASAFQHFAVIISGISAEVLDFVACTLERKPR